MKKLFSALLVVLMILGVPGGLATAGTVTAPRMKASSTGMTTLVFTLGSTKYTVNGTSNTMNVGPFSSGGRTLIPIRYALQPLGGEVSWYQDEQRVAIFLDPVDISVWVGNPIADINGVRLPIDENNPNVKPVNVKGRIFVPLRFVLQAISADVIWGPVDKSITIRYPKPAMIAFNGTDFTMNYPEIWDAQPEEFSTEFISPEGDIVNVGSEDISSTVTLQQYTNSAIAQLRQVYPDLSFIQQADVTISDSPGHLVVYTGNLDGITAKVMQAWTVVGDKAYVLTYFPQPQAYDNYADTAAEMFDSFALK